MNFQRIFIKTAKRLSVNIKKQKLSQQLPDSILVFL